MDAFFDERFALLQKLSGKNDYGSSAIADFGVLRLGGGMDNIKELHYGGSIIRNSGLSSSVDN